MAAAIGVRDDYDAEALRAAAKRSKDGPQARRREHLKVCTLNRVFVDGP